jgi:VanZ family protein
VFHRHPFLSLTTFVYLGFVGWLTLTPQDSAPTASALVLRVVARLQVHDPRFTYDRVEFMANVGLFVPVGVFLVLMFGARFWWLAAISGFALTSAIETAQRSIPGRVSDPRDIVANTSGALIGVVLALVLTMPATLRRRRRRLARDRQGELVGRGR